MKAQYPHTKMIMITGYPSANQDKALLEQGITAWLQKPFSADDIAQVVAQALT
jgi:CheY-like chemotaxis protein